MRGIESDQTIDLARLEIDKKPSFELQAKWIDHLPQGMLVTIAGYPQYAPGTSLWRSQGTVSGLRSRMGSPRVVINGLIDEAYTPGRDVLPGVTAGPLPLCNLRYYPFE